MSRKAISLKAIIRNLAKEKDISAQVKLQNYMFEQKKWNNIAKRRIK
ncbi:MAG: hypothetical protein RBT15_08715 [Gudongella sp.]|jgi:hypothetical protein|nr:hypothetical protein [Gudongella sp.]